MGPASTKSQVQQTHILFVRLSSPYSFLKINPFEVLTYDLNFLISVHR